MRIEVLTIGDELLDGRVADTNTVYLGAVLGELGHAVAQRTSITDDVDIIGSAARECVGRGTRLCIVSGGLGPTSDDVTAEAFAALSGRPLLRDESVAEALRERFARRGLTLTDNQLRQADRPDGSELLPNAHGTAPGFAVEFEGCRFVCLPGVPTEFRAMVEAIVLGPLQEGAVPAARGQLRVFGLTEGAVGQKLVELPERFGHVRLGFRAHMPEIHVTLRAARGHEGDLDAAMLFAREQLGENVFTLGEESLAEVVLGRLRRRGETLAAAESCTGGRVADLVTNIAGCSDVFVGAMVAYHNDIKQRWLGVAEATLVEHGAVSEATVQQMADGVREQSGASWGVAVSGVAGPAGGTPDKPVGTVWLATSGPVATTRRLSLPFDRERNKLVSAYAVLDLVRRSIEKLEEVG